MLFLLFTIHVCAESTYIYPTPEGTLTYSIENEKIYIKSYHGRDTILEIPETIAGRPVFSVKLYEGKKNADVHEVKLPSTVRILPWESMSYFEELEKVTGTEFVEQLAGYNFEGTKIKHLVFSENLRIISCGAFAAMRELISLTIPDDCRITTSQAFYSNFALQKITLIKTGKTPALTLDGPALYSADMKTLIVYPCASAQVSYRIPDGVETIEEYAFAMIQSFDGGLTDVVIPASVTNISPFTQYAYGGGVRSMLPHLHVYEGSAAHKMLIDHGYDPLDYYVISKGEHAVTVEDRINEIIQQYTRPQMTDYEKAFVIYRWFAEHTSYDRKRQITTRVY